MKEFFENIWQSIVTLFTVQIGIGDIIDIVIMSLLIYFLLRMTKKTRARQVIKGLGILVAAAVVSSWLNLSMVNWLFSMLLQWFLLILVIIFQPELRQALEHLGRGLAGGRAGSQDSDAARVIDEIIKTVQNLSRRKVGALIVLRQSATLNDIVETGTVVDAVVSSMLLENIFEPNTPLHDGAVVISNMRVTAAGCFLPLSDNMLLDRKLGTRHRAALGISERSDAVALVVSEETGVVSYAKDGSLHRYIDTRSLRELLDRLFASEQKNAFGKLDKLFKNIFKNDKDED